MYDLTVIGGGPAGAAAAITAARSGSCVLLLERGRFPRHKVCGEFVSSESLGLVTKLLDWRDLLQQSARISRARLFVDDQVLSTTIEPAAASVARYDLDSALWDSARACGVDARQQVTVQSVLGSGPFLVNIPGEQFQTRAVVNASGRWSNLTRGSNGDNKKKWIGLKAHFAEIASPPSVDLYFFDGGYCGVQPVKLTADFGQTRINACAMVRADTASTLPEVFELHPALRERSAHWQPLTDPVSVAPLRFARPQPLGDGVLLVGDAAGFVDPFVGDGISLALRSGALAAECLLPFFCGAVSLKQASSQYANEYRKQLTPVFRSSARIRNILSWPRTVRAPIVALFSNLPAATRYLVRNTR